ncbi:nuclear transport factor 2 family protein [Streptomyces olivochromogenes]|uniref:Polyketide cyclase n=1 Tax=Streptomyces olivochromogenes TaxID=1963 RepID=A0A250VMI8_STROL|nr:nuclear transport factor 2 family protein [Streptomyces olivochromogenes]KUN42187.1 hypothetical protein AQJ27_38155 [Streptomyces olivochromogenes]GAX55304.1 polyketide cyclase [Streptomyces olivochromogenes]
MSRKQSPSCAPSKTRTRPSSAKLSTLFNKRDEAAAERFWSPDYIQHSARIAPSREGRFDLVKSLPAGLKHEGEPIMAEGDMAMVRGRFSLPMYGDDFPEER